MVLLYPLNIFCQYQCRHFAAELSWALGTLTPRTSGRISDSVRLEQNGDSVRREFYQMDNSNITSGEFTPSRALRAALRSRGDDRAQATLRSTACKPCWKVGKRRVSDLNNTPITGALPDASQALPFAFHLSDWGLCLGEIDPRRR